MSATPIAVTIDLEIEHFDNAYVAELKHNLADFLGVSPDRIGVKPCVPTSKLKSFSGKVERVGASVAYLTLVDEQGQEAFAEYDATELDAQGITEGTPFNCTIETRNHKTVVSFEPIAERHLSESEWNCLTKETEDALGDYEPKDDY